jgi:hypothetical protein
MNTTSNHAPAAGAADPHRDATRTQASRGTPATAGGMSPLPATDDGTVYLIRGKRLSRSPCSVAASSATTAPTVSVLATCRKTA